MTTPHPTRTGGRGITLVETLVVIGIVGLLLSLLLPAVQAAREASRRTLCAHQLRQIVLALGAYQATLDVYPGLLGKNVGKRFPRDYSAFTQMLAFLDSPHIFHAINFDLPVDDPYYAHREAGYGIFHNATVMRLKIDGFLCPSDGGGGDQGWTGGTNYRFSMGIEHSDSSGRPTGGILSTRYHPITAAGVRDGLSNTIAASERLRGRLDAPRNLRTDLIFSKLEGDSTSEHMYQRCAKQPSTAPHLNATGLTWFIGSLAHTSYNHMHPPNAGVPDCVMKGIAPPWALVGARSNHAGGVNVGVGDGSVRFVSDSIDRSVWKALGTRAGGEIIDSNW